MYNKFPPCKECADRCIGCHSNCLRYTKYHNARQEYLNKRHKILKNESMIIAYNLDKHDYLRRKGYI